MSHTHSTHLCANPLRECCYLDVKYHPLPAHTPLPSDLCLDSWSLVTSTVLRGCGISETVVKREEVGCGMWALGDSSLLILTNSLFPDLRRCEEPRPQAPSTLPSPPQHATSPYIVSPRVALSAVLLQSQKWLLIYETPTELHTDMPFC